MPGGFSLDAPCRVFLGAQRRRNAESPPWYRDGLLWRGGSYRDRTDDIHGVSVALYQLS